MRLEYCEKCQCDEMAKNTEKQKLICYLIIFYPVFCYFFIFKHSIVNNHTIFEDVFFILGKYQRQRSRDVSNSIKSTKFFFKKFQVSLIWTGTKTKDSISRIMSKKDKVDEYCDYRT